MGRRSACIRGLVDDVSPLADLFAAIDASNRARRFAGLAVVFVLGLCFLGGAWIDADLSRAPRLSPRACADRLGIQWDVVNGATERLAAFSACVAGR